MFGEKVKTLNVKRIATIAAGAALLGVGLAFAGPITFQNVPIISNSGQPVVQIVVGSTSQPSDGVAAANIAAAIGNLAYTSVPVTASINSTQAKSVLSANLGSGSTYTLSNQQVWLNESGATTVASGTYAFAALIGSVLNRGLKLSSPDATKFLQGTGQYSYPDAGSSTGISLTASPVASPYTGQGYASYSAQPSASTAGGIAFTGGFQGVSNANDNILRITSSDLPSLASNSGANGESEYLWVTGFPVYDQQTGIAGLPNFVLMSAGGAYQVVFNKPIHAYTSGGSTTIDSGITLLGQNWTIINETGLGGSASGSGSALNGGSITLASSASPLTTVYVGQNLTAGAFKVTVTDLGQANSNGVSPASLNVYYNGALTNTSSVSPGTTARFNVTGHNIYVNVNSTFAGYYSYQKYAKLRLYTNINKISDGSVFNQTTNPGWNVNLFWTNTSKTSGGAGNDLYSIVIYNSTPTQTLFPGQSISFITDPASWKFTFVGETLTGSNYDTVKLQTSGTLSQITYNNLGPGAVNGAVGAANVIEPAQYLTVTSSIPGAFSYAGQTSSTVQYDLTPYQLAETGNALSSANALVASALGLATTNANVVITTAGPTGNWITNTDQLTVTIKGNVISGGKVGASQQQQVTFNSIPVASGIANALAGAAFWNITSITLSRAIPGTISVGVFAYNSVNAPSTNALAVNAMATLSNTVTPVVLYQTSSQSGSHYTADSNAISNTLYNQFTGATTGFTLATLPESSALSAGNFFSYTMNEIAVASNTEQVDSLAIAIRNNTSGIGNVNEFQLNYSLAGQHNNMTYTSTQGHQVYAEAGFRTEKGSKVASVGPNEVDVNFAKNIDALQFTVAPSSTTNGISKSYALSGPYAVGAQTNIANVTIGKVTANVSVSGASNLVITGISNIKATASISQATTPTLLKNLSSTSPLVVLDAAANPSSNLILIGSGFVNTLSKQLEQSQNLTFTSTSAPVLQAYGTNKILVAGYYANQTTMEANNFIQQLYAQASQ